MGQNNKNVIETPSSFDFNSLSNEIKEEVKKYADEWKNASQNTGDRNTITCKVKKIYGSNSLEYEYFRRLKGAKSVLHSNKKNKSMEFVSKEGILRDKFARILREYLKKYLDTNETIDTSTGIFMLDENYNLPPQFWIRMNRDVLPCIVTKDKDNEQQKIHAWTLGIAVIKKHEDELIWRLQKTDFKDLNHIVNSVIQFFNKYMLVTYREIRKQAKKEIEDKQRREATLQQEKSLNTPITNIHNNRRGGLHKTKNVKFNTDGLL